MQHPKAGARAGAPSPPPSHLPPTPLPCSWLLPCEKMVETCLGYSCPQLSPDRHQRCPQPPLPPSNSPATTVLLSPPSSSVSMGQPCVTANFSGGVGVGYTCGWGGLAAKTQHRISGKNKQTNNARTSVFRSLFTGPRPCAPRRPAAAPECGAAAAAGRQGGPRLLPGVAPQELEPPPHHLSSFSPRQGRRAGNCLLPACRQPCPGLVSALPAAQGKKGSAWCAVTPRCAPLEARQPDCLAATPVCSAAPRPLAHVEARPLAG